MKLLPTIIIAALLGCGKPAASQQGDTEESPNEDSGDNIGAVSQENDIQATNVVSLSDDSRLPKCDAKLSGKYYFIEREKMLKVCGAKGWSEPLVNNKSAKSLISMFSCVVLLDSDSFEVVANPALARKKVEDIVFTYEISDFSDGSRLVYLAQPEQSGVSKFFYSGNDAFDAAEMSLSGDSFKGNIRLGESDDAFLKVSGSGSLSGVGAYNTPYLVKYTFQKDIKKSDCEKIK